MNKNYIIISIIIGILIIGVSGFIVLNQNKSDRRNDG